MLRRFSALAFVLLTVLGAALPLRADLVWTPGAGWRIEGGAFAGLAGEEGRNALELMNNARNAEEAGRERSALKGYGRVIKRYPSSLYASEAYYRSAILRNKRKEYYKAFDAYQQLLLKFPATPRFNAVIGEQYRIASRLLDGERSYIWGLFPGFRNRERGIEYFEQIVANAPYSDYAPLSLMNVARGHQRLDNTEEAIDALDRMINSYPRNLLTPDAYLKIAQTHASLVEGGYYDQASTKQAVTYFEDYMILFPGDAGMAQAETGLAKMKTVLAESKLTIADYYYKYRRNYKAAKVFYNEAITVYPDSDVAKQAREKLVDVDAKLEAQAAAAAGQPAPKAPEPKKKKKLWLF